LSNLLMCLRIAMMSIGLFLLCAFMTGCGGGAYPHPTPNPSPNPSPGPTQNWTPTISSLSPASVVAGSPDFQLTVNGSGLHSPYPDEGTGIVYVGSLMLVPTSRSDTSLVVTVPASAVANSGAVPVSVGYTDFVTNTINLQVSPPSSVPSIAPSAEILGPNATCQFAASGFDNNSNVNWYIQEEEVGGAISNTGRYTAPSQTGIFHVVAISPLNPSQYATATVTISPGGFVQIGDMHVARTGHTATLLTDGRVLVAGGDISTEIFDPTTNSFSNTGSMVVARNGATATLLADGRVLITGGVAVNRQLSDNPESVLTSAELYDPLKGTFQKTGSMHAPRFFHTATLLADGRVLVAGGTGAAGGSGDALASTELYDPATGMFTDSAFMNSARAQHTATLLPSGKVLIIGGWNGHRADAPDDPPWDPLSAEIFNPVTGNFLGAGNMSTTRSGHCTTLARPGKAIVLGGIPAIQNLHTQPLSPSYAEIFDSDLLSFVPLPNVEFQPSAFSCTLLANGLLLIAGGEIGESVISYAVLLDPATGTFTASGSLITPRKGHTANLLNDGRVLVTGGVDSGGRALASAELFR